MGAANDGLITVKNVIAEKRETSGRRAIDLNDSNALDGLGARAAEIDYLHIRAAGRVAADDEAIGRRRIAAKHRLAQSRTAKGERNTILQVHRDLRSLSMQAICAAHQSS